MKIGIIYSTSKKSTKKSCKLLYDKINADVQLIPIDKAKTACILKYNFIIFVASAYRGKIDSNLKIYLMRNFKNIAIKRKNIRHLINIYVLTINEKNLNYPKKGKGSQIINSNKKHDEI